MEIPGEGLPVDVSERFVPLICLLAEASALTAGSSTMDAWKDHRPIFRWQSEQLNVTSDFGPVNRLIDVGVHTLTGEMGRSMADLGGFEALTREGALLSEAEVARETDWVTEPQRCTRG